MAEPEIVKVKVKMYTDDTKINEDQTKCSSLHLDLKRLEEWSRKLLLKFNELKCKVRYFGKNNPKHTYTLGNTELEKVTTEKDLGVHITDDAKPSTRGNSMKIYKDYKPRLQTKIIEVYLTDNEFF